MNNSWNLNPSYGNPIVVGDTSYYLEFSYNWQRVADHLFFPGKAFDFEVNLGAGGQKSNWYNILRTRGNPTGLEDSGQVLNYCGTSYNYLTQVFKICIQIPDAINDAQLVTKRLPNVGYDQMVDIYLRTTPNAAYRETIWPETFDKIKRFKGILTMDLLIGKSSLDITGSSEYLGLGLTESGNSLMIGQNTYAISSVTQTESGYTITLTAALTENHSAGETVFLTAELTSQYLFISINNQAFNNWNSFYSATGTVIPNELPQLYTTDSSNCLYCLDLLQNFTLSPKCQRFDFPLLITNIVGGNFILSNNWADFFNLDLPFFHFNQGIQMTAVQKDFLASTVTAQNQTNPQIVINQENSKALVVWEANTTATGYDIRGG